MSENEIRNEVLNKNSEIKEIDISLHEVCKSICKIMYKNQFGTGFLIKLYKDEKELYCLMTNEHVITKDIIDSNEIIDVNYYFEKKWIKIKLDNTKRFIKYDLVMDITIIEIIPDDKIKEKYFLLPNINKVNHINEDIYIVQFPEGKNLSYSEGKIKNINNFEIIYNASTNLGSSGSPILLKNTTKVIGIHKKGHIFKKMNYGTLIYSFIESLQSQKENNQEKYKLIDNNSTEIYENGEFYIGQSLKGKKHGKGIILNINGNIIYEGDFVYGKKEGKGKFFFGGGGCYIGNFVNGKMEGKGALYDKKDELIYEGDFVNNKREGSK